ncbi:MAG: hypothetical protein ACRCYX_16020 [Dermatophilaceae bacterium]
MIARLGSVLVALPACAVGYALVFWTAGRVIVGDLGVGGSDSATLTFVASVGALFLGIAMATTAWSSAGVFILAAGNLVVGTVAVVSPQGGPGGSPTSDIGRGAEVALVGGQVLAIGVILLVGGVTARACRRPGGADRDESGPLMSVLVAFVGGLPGLVLVLAGGIENYGEQVLNERGPQVLPIALLIVGLVALAATLAYARWSAFGLGVVGPLVVGLGLATQVEPAMLTGLATAARPESVSVVVLAVRDQAMLGFVTAIGALVTAAAVTVRVARAARPAGHDPVRSGEGESVRVSRREPVRSGEGESVRVSRREPVRSGEGESAQSRSERRRRRAR